MSSVMNLKFLDISLIDSLFPLLLKPHKAIAFPLKENAEPCKTKNFL